MQSVPFFLKKGLFWSYSSTLCKMKKESTIDDIAGGFDISPYAVSGALHNNKQISHSTRKMILGKAVEMG